MKKFLILLLALPLCAFSAPQYTWESQGASYTGQIDLGSSSTDPLSGSLTPSYGAINAQNAVQPPVVVVSSTSGGGGQRPRLLEALSRQLMLVLCLNKELAG